METKKKSVSIKQKSKKKIKSQSLSREINKRRNSLSILNENAIKIQKNLRDSAMSKFMSKKEKFGVKKCGDKKR